MDGPFISTPIFPVRSCSTPSCNLSISFFFNDDNSPYLQGRGTTRTREGVVSDRHDAQPGPDARSRCGHAAGQGHLDQPCKGTVEGN